MILAIQMGNQLDAAEPTLDELGKIAVFLENNDVDALAAFLEVNPDLMEGDTQFAVLLRQFMDESEDMNAFFSLKDAGDDLRNSAGSWDLGSGDSPDASRGLGLSAAAY